jgi:XTP/dITP diphosphohydrolase
VVLPDTMRLVLATSNPGKVREFQVLLPFPVERLSDHPDVVMPPEVGETFVDNARAKAEFVAERLGCPAVADDSGLCVDALQGAPGIHSARYAEGTDLDRVRKLLAAMEGVPAEKRTGRFVCAMAFSVPGRSTIVCEGVLEGAIGFEARGQNGFGYDPIFLVGTGQTAAELDRDQKNRISHRGQALRQLFPEILRHFSLEPTQTRPAQS